MKHAALGFRAHSGWTALVAMSLENNQPHVLVRQRPKLVETFTYEFRQPYHTAEKMSLQSAREFLSRIESGAKRLAEGAIRSVQTDLRKRGHELTCFGLPLASGRPLPKLEKILSSHALVHTADGELFRQALMQASASCQITGFTIRERDLLGLACETLRMKNDELRSRLSALGKALGAPWAQDEKLAALAAWLALLSRAKAGPS